MKFSRHFIVFFALLALLGACGGKSGFTLDRSDVSADLDSCMTLLKKKKHSRAISCLESYKSRHQGEASAAEAELAMAELDPAMIKVAENIFSINNIPNLKIYQADAFIFMKKSLQ